MNLQELRKKYPDYNDMSDEQFAQAFHRKFYSDMDFKTFSTKIGYNQPINQKEVLKKQRTTIGEDIAQGFAGVGNLADTFGTMAAGGIRTLLGQNKGGRLDPMFEALAERKRSRLDWAGGQGKEKGVSGALISALAGLPGMVLAPVTGLERATDLMDAGAPLKEAGPAGAIDSVLSTGAALLPVVGKTIVGKIATGAGANVLTGGASDVATQGLVTDREIAEKYNPLDPERRLSELILGAAGGALTGRTTPKSKGRVTPQPDPVAALDADLKPPVASSVVVPEQMELDLTTSPQAIAEMQARQIGQRDLFAPVNEPFPNLTPQEMITALETRQEARTPLNPVNPIETVRQNELFDQPEQGLVSNPYAANMGDWRIDENGMPIRADLSMELQNLQNPLQRNLFGDELQPRVDPIGQSADLFDSQRQFNEQGVQGGIPLTQAMDSMEPNAMRSAVEQTQMGRELPQSPELAAVMLQNDGMRVPQGQRGAVDATAIQEGFAKLAQAFRGVSIHNQEFMKELPAELETFRDTGYNPSVINYIRQDAKVAGYGPEIDGIFKEIQSAAEKYQEAKAVERLPFETKNKWNTAKNAVAEIEKRQKELDAKLALLPEGYSGIGRSAQAQKRALLKQYNELDDAISSIQPPYVRDLLKDPSASARDISFAVEDLDISALKKFAQESTVSNGRDNVLSFIPKSQRGAIDLGNGTENSNTKKRIAALDVNSPEVLEAKNQIALDNKKNVVAQIPGIGIEGYRNNIDTPEKVIASAPQAKDITKFQRIRGETVSPGINNLVINTNNPLLKFVRGKTRGVFLESEALARLYITDKATGIGTVLNRMTQQEKNQMVAALQKGDKLQQYWTRAQLQKAGFSENVITAVEKFYEMDRKKLEVWNDARAKVGMEPVTERPGHFPGVFKGDYKQLVLVDGKVKGVIAVDTKAQLAKAKAKMHEQFPNAKFSTVHRNALGGNGRKSDMFSGMNDVLTMLARNDPEFAKVQELIQTAVKENADALYGAAVHSMAKKGVVGNAGNKPWQDVNTNTNEAIKAYLEYWEEGIISHKNLVVETEIKGLMDNPALDHMPNAKEYVNSYIKNMTGRDIGTIGDALNKLLDAPFKATGLGPTIPREIVNQLNKRLGQHTMGWFNWMFTAIQYLQVPQMALPEMVKIARDLNIPMAKDVSTSMTAALLDLTKEKISGEGSPLIKEAIAEAEKRGLGVFSEYQDINKVTQNKYSKMYDDLIDLNRSLPERQTRPLVFYSFVKMLENSGMSKAEIFEVAHNATQRSMVDYSPRERPMMYQRLGVIGQLAGSLQTFKHAQLSQLSSFFSRGDVTALATASLVLLALTGIKGFPAYQELDQLYQYLSDKFFNDRRTIADTVLKDLPEWMKSGALSVAGPGDKDINVQGRFSAANVVPDTLAEAAMPLGSVLFRQGEAAWNLATKQDPLAMNEFLRHMAPSGPIKGMVETTFNVDEDGTPIDKRGLKGNPRSEWDTLVKRIGAGTSLPEALRSEKQWNQMQRERANKDSQKSTLEKMQRAAAQGLLTPELQQELITKYVEREGDPQQFINAMVEYQKVLQLNKQQRLEGIPNGSLPSVNRYRNYQE